MHIYLRCIDIGYAGTESGNDFLFAYLRQTQPCRQFFINTGRDCTSIDEGLSWSRETRISLCSGMMGMAEMKDGRVLVVFHEAYRTPTRIRGHYMRVRPDGSLTSA